jgi:hypothetical protein
MIVHFASAGWDALEPWLDARPELSEQLLYAFEYADHRVEFEPDDLERLCRLLGGYPAAAVCLQLRRSLGDRSCDAAAGLTVDLLRAFAGVADDTFADGDEGYWSLPDLEAGVVRRHGRFLDCYRTGR